MTVLTCDKCETQFEVPESALIGGRKVRCTNCMHIWYQADPNADDLADVNDAGDDKKSFSDILKKQSDNEPEQEPEGAVIYEEAEAVPDALRPTSEIDNSVTITEDEETKKMSTKTAVALFVGMFLLTLIIILAAQKTLVSKFPQTAPMFEAVGIKAKPVWDGFKIQEGISILRKVNGKDMLYIESTIVNISDKNKRVPPVRVDLTDIDTGDVLQTWRPDMVRITLGPGEKHQIKLGFTDIKHKVGNVKIYFRDFD